MSSLKELIDENERKCSRALDLAIGCESDLLRTIATNNEGKFKTIEEAIDVNEVFIDRAVFVLKNTTIQMVFCDQQKDAIYIKKYYVPIMHKLSSLLYELVIINSKLKDKRTESI